MDACVELDEIDGIERKQGSETEVVMEAGVEAEAEAGSVVIQMEMDEHLNKEI